jgi:hypothetical protein
MERSKGHIAFIGDYEYFEHDGKLYCAPTWNDLDIWGYRGGARFECYAHMTKQRIALISQAVNRFA